MTFLQAESCPDMQQNEILGTEFCLEILFETKISSAIILSREQDCSMNVISSRKNLIKGMANCCMIPRKAEFDTSMNEAVDLLCIVEFRVRLPTPQSYRVVSSTSLETVCEA